MSQNRLKTPQPESSLAHMNHYRASLLVSAALLLSGCDNERTDPDRAECDSSKPSQTEIQKQTQATTPPQASAPAQNVPQPQPAIVSKPALNRQDVEIEALKREIEDLRKRLKSESARNGAPRSVSLFESLAQTRTLLEEMNSGFVALFNVPTEELIRQRIALGPEPPFGQYAETIKRADIRRVLMTTRIRVGMSREEVYRIVGKPDLSRGDIDYYLTRYGLRCLAIGIGGLGRVKWGYIDVTSGRWISPSSFYGVHFDKDFVSKLETSLNQPVEPRQDNPLQFQTIEFGFPTRF